MGRKSKSLRRASCLWTDFHQSLHEEVHVTSQRKQTLTFLGIFWPSNMFIGRNKSDTHETSNKDASKEQLNSMSKQLVMKFMVQLHRLPKCLERKRLVLMLRDSWFPGFVGARASHKPCSVLASSRQVGSQASEAPDVGAETVIDQRSFLFFRLSSVPDPRHPQSDGQDLKRTSRVYFWSYQHNCGVPAVGIHREQRGQQAGVGVASTNHQFQLQGP